MLRRYLEYRGYEVTFVQNFTDVDDKIIKRANEEGVTYQEIAERYIEEYWTDAKGLGVREATVHPKATENMERDHRHHRRRWSTRAMPTERQMGMCTSAPCKV